MKTQVYQSKIHSIVSLIILYIIRSKTPKYFIKNITVSDLPLQQLSEQLQD